MCNTSRCMFESASDTLSKNQRPFIESVPDVTLNCHNLSPIPFRPIITYFNPFRLDFGISSSPLLILLLCSSFQLVLVEIACEENTCLNLYGFPEHRTKIHLANSNFEIVSKLGSILLAPHGVLVSTLLCYISLYLGWEI